MFVQAIERVSEFVRPIYIICRYLGSTEVDSGTATFFFVNDQGYALMCCHTFENIKDYAKSFEQYELYKQYLEDAPKHGKKRDEYIKSLYKQTYNGNDTIQLNIRFKDKFKEIKFIDAYPQEDLLLVQFVDIKGIDAIAPIFKKETSDIKEGKHLCQSGFAFSYFDNYRYNKGTDRIEWTNEGIIDSKPFNVDGMVARKLGGQLTMTTPGYDGMSGGPVFDEDGCICGMQHHVIHEYTNFDCDRVPIWHNTKKHEVTQYPFAHFAQCTAVDTMKNILRKNKVDFMEG